VSKRLEPGVVDVIARDLLMPSAAGPRSFSCPLLDRYCATDVLGAPVVRAASRKDLPNFPC